MSASLQWGGRFTQASDASLLAFGSSLADDLPLAACDVRCSLAHVEALAAGRIVDATIAASLRDALAVVASEIDAGTFEDFACSSGAEDIHGAIDARVRALAGTAGELLHAGRSRNDQVATTLRLYVAQQCDGARVACADAVAVLAAAAAQALQAQTVLPAMTHWQPAQPALLAFWLCAAAQPLVRAAERCARAANDARCELPLGSAALCGSTLPLDREAARKTLGFAQTSANAMDAVGARDVALDGAHAVVMALTAASRICEELVMWCNPLLAFASLGDAASTGSSLMPQKRNPDPFELVRGLSAVLIGTYAGALASTSGVALSYHRDLQQTKAAIVDICSRGPAALRAFATALAHVRYNGDAMNASAGEAFTVATDVADDLIASGTTAREAHAIVGAHVRELESNGGTLDEQLTPLQSVQKKQTAGSTHPDRVRAHIAALEVWVREARLS